eukprot:781465_1
MSPSKNGRTHAKSTASAMPPPRNPYANRKYPQKIIPSKGSSFDPNQQIIQPFPAPFVPPPPTTTWKNGGHKISKSQMTPNKKPNFDLQSILLPGQDSKENMYDDDCDEDIPLPNTNINTNSSIQNVPKISANMSIDTNNRKKVRRNRDSIVWTPTTASVIEDSTFMDVMNNPPDKR